MQREQLEQRVEIHKLDAGAAVNLVFGHNLEILFHHTVGVVVTVGTRLREDVSVATHTHNVHAPGINADGGYIQPHCPDLFETLADFVEEIIKIAVCAAGNCREAVGEAVNLFQLQLAVQAGQDYPAAGRAQIDAN